MKLLWRTSWISIPSVHGFLFIYVLYLPNYWQIYVERVIELGQILLILEKDLGTQIHLLMYLRHIHE